MVKKLKRIQSINPEKLIFQELEFRKNLRNKAKKL